MQMVQEQYFYLFKDQAPVEPTIVMLNAHEKAAEYLEKISWSLFWNFWARVTGTMTRSSGRLITRQNSGRIMLLKIPQKKKRPASATVRRRS